MSLETDVRAHLSAASLGVVNIYCGPARPADPPAIPHRAIFVLETGGPPPSPYMDLQDTSWRFQRAQVRVRGEANDYAAGQALASAVWSHMQTGAVTGGYIRCTVEQSSPLYMGRDGSQCHEWSISCLLEKRG